MAKKKSGKVANLDRDEARRRLRTVRDATAEMLRRLDEGQPLTRQAEEPEEEPLPGPAQIGPLIPGQDLLTAWWNALIWFSTDGAAFISDPAVQEALEPVETRTDTEDSSG